MVPPQSVLVAVDFSEPSRVALACGARLARSVGATLQLLHAQHPSLGTAARAGGVDLRTEVREEMHRFVRATPPAADARPAAHVVEGDAVTVICDIAVRERVDLVVLGTRGLSGSAHAAFGSVTEGVLVRSEVSILAVPVGWTAPDPSRADLSGTGPIVSGLECTTPALGSTAAACRLAHALGTSIRAVHVVPTLAVLDRWRAHADAACSRQADEARRELEPLLPTLRCAAPLTLHVETGVVPDRLAAAAAAAGAGALLVLGRRSRNSRRGAPGDIARRVLAQTAIPVLVHLPEA